MARPLRNRQPQPHWRWCRARHRRGRIHRAPSGRRPVRRRRSDPVVVGITTRASPSSWPAQTHRTEQRSARCRRSRHRASIDPSARWSGRGRSAPRVSPRDPDRPPTRSVQCVIQLAAARDDRPCSSSATVATRRSPVRRLPTVRSPVGSSSWAGGRGGRHDPAPTTGSSPTGSCSTTVDVEPRSERGRPRWWSSAELVAATTHPAPTTTSSTLAGRPCRHRRDRPGRPAGASR